MELAWQTTSNTTFPYIWCHGCEQPLEGGLSIRCPQGRERDPSWFWLRLCPSCIDKINSFLRKELIDGLAAPSSYIHEGAKEVYRLGDPRDT